MRWTWPAQGFWKRQAGVTAETLALSIGLAVVLGVFPVYGCPTLLCAAAAILLRLNLPAMQLVNILTAPLQLALLIPFHRLGSLLLPEGVAAVPQAAHSAAWRLFAGLLTLTTHAIAGWSCVCIPLGILLYLTLKYAGRQWNYEASLHEETTGVTAG